MVHGVYELVLGRIHICLPISDLDLTTRICRFYDYIPRATDLDMYPQIWELFTSCQSILIPHCYKFCSCFVHVHITPKNLSLPRYMSSKVIMALYNFKITRPPQALLDGLDKSNIGSY